MYKTQIDECRDWLIAHGCNKQQVYCKTADALIPAVLDFVTQKGDLYTKLAEDEETAIATANVLKTLTELVNEKKSEIAELEQRRSWLIDTRTNEIMGYIEEFHKAIQECETPEARDRLKMLQMFVNTVEVDTKYDNTAFINGIASILSGVSASVDKLQKVTADEFAQKKAYRTI